MVGFLPCGQTSGCFKCMMCYSLSFSPSGLAPALLTPCRSRSCVFLCGFKSTSLPILSSCSNANLNRFGKSLKSDGFFSLLPERWIKLHTCKIFDSLLSLVSGDALVVQVVDWHDYSGSLFYFLDLIEVSWPNDTLFSVYVFEMSNKFAPFFMRLLELFLSSSNLVIQSNPFFRAFFDKSINCWWCSVRHYLAP